MTDNLLQKLEEKMMVLLTELESLRRETVCLRQENNHLKAEYNHHTKKLQDLLLLLDCVDTVPSPAMLHEETI